MPADNKPPTRSEIKEGRPARQEADRLASEADRLERRSEELGAEIDQVRSDWRRKRADESVPGAIPPEGDEGRPQEATDKDG